MPRHVNLLVMTDLTDDEVRTAWCETLRVVHTTSSELENELQDQHDLGLSEYEVLCQIGGVCGQGDGKVKMKDLETRMYLSQSALSRTVTRLEKAGLVTRAVCEFDRRAMFLQLTEPGRRRWELASPTHLAVLRRNMARIEALAEHSASAPA